MKVNTQVFFFNHEKSPVNAQNEINEQVKIRNRTYKRNQMLILSPISRQFFKIWLLKKCSCANFNIYFEFS